MTMQAEQMVLASLSADSLALGAHWIYETKEIDDKIGRVEGLLAPLPGSYHPNKGKGDFTHYGDQTLLLLESLVRHQGFQAVRFAEDWRQYMQQYTGYMDKASKATLENMDKGQGLTEAGSRSNDLAGAARIAPLMFLYRQNLDRLLEAVREQTVLTHNNPATLAGADLIARIAWAVLQGTKPAQAAIAEVEKGVQDIGLDTRLRAALDSAGEDSRAAIRAFGQTCAVDSALPGVVHLVLKYEDDLRSALIENVMAGGDSAARGLAVGLILGAGRAGSALPQEWSTGLRQYNRIQELLAALARVQI
ncbi:MAG: ADP-ribosylglycohydrolase family protein [Desulfobulbaceae bacterium]|nr:ADP-ribosylglycohydrolase family protein [Desulfobulbaceae bacterium]